MTSKLTIIAAAVGLLGGGAALLMVAGPLARPSVRPITGADFGLLRHEALTLFPRGLPVATAAQGLTALGFLCTPAHRLRANVNAPSVECDSEGRGYPDTARMEVTVMARNGALSDIVIGNGVDSLVADARTPDPNHTASLR